MSARMKIGPGGPDITYYAFRMGDFVTLYHPDVHPVPVGVYVKADKTWETRIVGGRGVIRPPKWTMTVAEYAAWTAELLNQGHQVVESRPWE